MYNKVFRAAISMVLAIITAVSVLTGCVGSDAIEIQLSNTATTAPSSTDPSASESETTAPTEETQPDESIIYPEETIEFALPDIETSYLQTDIYTTIDNNVFMDALVYLGYNIKKHRDDGMMWKYVYAGDKAGLGYLSNITYGGGCSGYETDANGKPDVSRFEVGDLVCASFATYVYLNYLPNVAGIDTSALGRPSSAVSAEAWYAMVQGWVEKGYCEYIPFDYTAGAIGNSFVEFTAEREIPIGSLVFFCNPRTSLTSGAHVAIYAGHANGYDWLYHVGNKNGPEFCAIQRMNFGPNARWPLAIMTPPNIVNIAPTLEIELVDKAGKPIPGCEFILKHPTSGKEISLGTTDADGKLVRTDLSYGDFELTQILPAGYSSQTTTHTIKITGVNNSYNKVRIVSTKE